MGRTRLSGLLLAGTLYAAPVMASTHSYVQVGPPVTIVEPPPAMPHPGYVWRPGYYRWNHKKYEWVHGAWVNPPRGHAVWIPGHWAHEARGYLMFYMTGRPYWLSNQTRGYLTSMGFAAGPLRR